MIKISDNYKTIKISEHAKERFAQRIDNIKGKDLIYYCSKNEEKLDNHIRKLYKHSMFLYHGRIGCHNCHLSYYINNDVVIVASKDTILTIYKVMCKTSDENNKNIIDTLREKILYNNYEINYSIPMIKYYKTIIKQNQKEMDKISDKESINKLREQNESLEKEIEETKVKIKDMEDQNAFYTSSLVGNSSFKK